MIVATVDTDGEKINLVGKQGTTWDLTTKVFQDTAKTIPLSLIGYNARGQFKKDYQKTSPVLIEFNCSIMPYDAVDNPDNNTVLINVLPAQSSALSLTKGVYDIEIYSGTDIVERIMEGTLEISQEVTRNA